MNSHWPNEQAQQHIEQMLREASGDLLVRRARADVDGSDGTAFTPGPAPIRGLAIGLVQRARRRANVAVP